MLKHLYNLATDKYNGPLASLAKSLLFVLSLAYLLIVKLLILYYGIRPYRAGCKIISVGNITVGGSGKTPLVEYISLYLKQKGRKVAIVTRGYRKKTAGCMDLADEPQMLREKLKGVPVVISADRVAGIKTAISGHGADTVILDDGFQQWRVKKDLEIVTINSANPFGNRKVLPAGLLRQPLSSLKKAGVFVLTRTDVNPHPENLRSFLQGINPAAMIAEAAYNPLGFYKLNEKEDLLGINTLKGKTAAMVCGIADPGSFRHTLKNLDIQIAAAFEFPDHHAYVAQDMDDITKTVKEKSIDAVITTEKDAVKLCALLDPQSRLQIYALRIGLQVTKNEKEFLERLSQLYGA